MGKLRTVIRFVLLRKRFVESFNEVWSINITKAYNNISEQNFVISNKKPWKRSRISKTLISKQSKSPSAASTQSFPENPISKSSQQRFSFNFSFKLFFVSLSIARIFFLHSLKSNDNNFN